jgi:hypothetical protein
MNLTKLLLVLVVTKQCFAITEIMNLHEERLRVFNTCEDVVDTGGYNDFSHTIRYYSDGINKVLNRPINLRKRASMDDKEKIAKAIFADLLTRKRLAQIDHAKGIRAVTRATEPYTNLCGQSGRTNHDLILRKMHTSMNDVIEHALIYIQPISPIQSTHMINSFNNGQYSDLFQLSGINKDDYMRWIEESFLEHMAGALSGNIAADVAVNQSENPTFWSAVDQCENSNLWSHVLSAISRHRSTLRYMGTSNPHSSYGSSTYASTSYSQPSYSQTYSSSSSGGRTSGSVGYGFGGGMPAYGFGATPNLYGNGSTSQFSSQPSMQTNASVYDSLFCSFGSRSSAAGGGSYGGNSYSTSYSFAPQAEVPAQKRRAAVPDFCNEWSTASEIHTYSGRSAGKRSGNAQLNLLDAVINTVRTKVDGAFSRKSRTFVALPQAKLLERINAWIDADRETEIKKYERTNRTLASALKTERDSVKVKIAEAIFPTAYWEGDTAAQTAADLSYVFSYLDTFYRSKIDLWMNSFITESLEAKNGDGTSCQKGIRERIITGLRVLDDCELNAIFAGPEAHEMMKRFWVSLNFHDSAENAQRLANNLKESPYGVKRHSRTETAATAFRRYVVDYIQSQGLSEDYTDRNTGDNYPEQINTMVDLFSDYYEEKIKIHM